MLLMGNDVWLIRKEFKLFFIRLLTPVVTERCNIFAHFSGLWGCWIKSFFSSCAFLPVSIKICFTHTARLIPSQFTSSLVFFRFEFFPLFISNFSQLPLPLFPFSFCTTHGLFLLGLSILNYPTEYLSTNAKLYPLFI